MPQPRVCCHSVRCPSLSRSLQPVHSGTCAVRRCPCVSPPCWPAGCQSASPQLWACLPGCPHPHHCHRLLLHLCPEHWQSRQPRIHMPREQAHWRYCTHWPPDTDRTSRTSHRRSTTEEGGLWVITQDTYSKLSCREMCCVVSEDGTCCCWGWLLWVTRPLDRWACRQGGGNHQAGSAGEASSSLIGREHGTGGEYWEMVENWEIRSRYRDCHHKD